MLFQATPTVLQACQPEGCLHHSQQMGHPGGLPGGGSSVYVCVWGEGGDFPG